MIQLSNKNSATACSLWGDLDLMFRAACFREPPLSALVRRQEPTMERVNTLRNAYEFIVTFLESMVESTVDVQKENQTLLRRARARRAEALCTRGTICANTFQALSPVVVKWYAIWIRGLYLYIYENIKFGRVSASPAQSNKPSLILHPDTRRAQLSLTPMTQVDY